MVVAPLSDPLFRLINISDLFTSSLLISNTFLGAEDWVQRTPTNVPDLHSLIEVEKKYSVLESQIPMKESSDVDASVVVDDIALLLLY